MFNESDEDFSSSSPLVITGIIAQPIVWTSLYFVATTGGGLPPGPFGLLGALEGISYLGVAGFACLSIVRNAPEREEGLTAVIGRLSILTILAGLAVLASLISHQGCVPNAKPLLDYSDFVTVCKSDNTPGLFGAFSR